MPIFSTPTRDAEYCQSMIATAKMNKLRMHRMVVNRRTRGSVIFSRRSSAYKHH